MRLKSNLTTSALHTLAFALLLTCSGATRADDIVSQASGQQAAVSSAAAEAVSRRAHREPRCRPLIRVIPDADYHADNRKPL